MSSIKGFLSLADKLDEKANKYFQRFMKAKNKTGVHFAAKGASEAYSEIAEEIRKISSDFKRSREGE